MPQFLLLPALSLHTQLEHSKTHRGCCPLRPKYDAPHPDPSSTAPGLPSQFFTPFYSVLTELLPFCLCSSKWVLPDHCPACPSCSSQVP